jgi:hypothetical protein
MAYYCLTSGVRILPLACHSGDRVKYLYRRHLEGMVILFLPACRFAGMFLLVLHFERMTGRVLPASHSEQKTGQAHLEQIVEEVVLPACWSEQNLTSPAAKKEGLILAVYYPAGKVTPFAAVWA